MQKVKKLEEKSVTKNPEDQKYSFIKNLETDTVLNVVVPTNTSPEQIKTIFKKYRPSFIPKQKEPHYFLIFFNDDQESANLAYNELQYHPINGGFMVLYKNSEKIFLSPEAKLYIRTNKELDPLKIHKHFDTAGKVAHIRQNNNGYFVQFYLPEDRDNAYQLLKDVEFEGELLIMEPSGKKHQFFKDSIFLKTKSPEIGVESKKDPKTSQQSDSFNSDEDTIKDSKNIIYERINSPPIKIEPTQSKDELKAKQSSSETVLADEKIQKIVTKLAKELRTIILNEKMVEVLCQKLSRLDKDILLDYLTDDDWFINFFLEIAK